MLKFLWVLFFAILFQPTFGQFRLGVFGGASNYQGDLVDKAYQSTKGAFGITVGYDISGRLNLRAGLTFAKVAGADSLTKQADLKRRNLSFQSPITEFSLIGEFNTFDLDEKKWSPYIFAGLAVYHFDPYTLDPSGYRVYLQPLRTEGEGLPGYGSKPYALTQLAIPFGAGIKYNISDRVRLGVEFGLRKLFTDYLDDVSGNYADAADLATYAGTKSVELSYRGDELPGGSPDYPAKGITRGSPKYKDYYYFTGIHLSFSLSGNGGSNSSGHGRKGYGCPASPL